MTSTDYSAIVARSVIVNSQILKSKNPSRSIFRTFTVMRREERCWSTGKIFHATWTGRRQIVLNCNRDFGKLKNINKDILRGRSIFAHQNDRTVIAKLLLILFPALAHSRFEAHRAADTLGHKLMRPRMATVSCNAKRH